jgi:hypothetical protein
VPLIAGGTDRPGAAWSKRFALTLGATAAVVLLAAPSHAAGATDLCPNTPKRAKPVAAGCASVEIVRRPETFAGPADNGLAAALGTIPALQSSARTAVRRVRSRVGAAAVLMGRGRVCPASRTYAGALRSLRAAHRALARALPAQQARLKRGFPPPFGDVSEGEMNSTALELGPVALRDAIGSVSRSLAGFRGPCNQVAGSFKVNRSMGRVDDAAGFLRQGGRQLAIASDLRAALFTGAQGAFEGIRFRDGTGVVLKASPAAGRLGGKRITVQMPQLEPVSCVKLGIVPFAWRSGANRPVHDLRGYQEDGGLWLEQGMEIAADQVCSGLTKEQPLGTTYTNYALRLSLEYTHVQGGFAIERVTKTLAPELSEGDGSVKLPSDMASFHNNGLLTVTELVRTCRGVPVLNIGKTGEVVWTERETSCAVKERDLPKQRFRVTALPTGGYAAVSYTGTAFDLDTRPAGTCRLAAVNGKTLDDSLDGASDVRFQAETWGASNQNAVCVSTRPSMTTITDLQWFAIHLEDPISRTLSATERLAQYGAETRSGVTWPRIEGNRGGEPFSYVARTPRIDRDLLSDCSTGAENDPRRLTDTFHRAPFDPDSATWRVSQGNRDDPGNWMNGVVDGTAIFSDFDGDGDTEEPYHPTYEWDILNDSNGDGVVELDHPIRASRAGWIALLDRNEKGNAGTGRNEVAGWPTAGSPIKMADPDDVVNYIDVGNYVWIRHSDGTYTTYNHLRYNTVPSKFKVGSWVRRGEVIAKNGNTGSSSAPHLHYGSFHVSSIPQHDPTKYFSARPSFLEDNDHPNGCWVPREQEFIDSNNTLIDAQPFFGPED